jgi:hypothetical protein
MAWQDEMIPITRYLINDIDKSSYSDSRLEEVLLISSQYLLMEIPFDNNYSIDINKILISPDPTTTSPKDTAFIALSCFRASWFIASMEVKAAANNCIRVTDGPSSLDATSVFTAKKQISDGLLSEYNTKKLQYLSGNITACAAIITPTTSQWLPGFFSPR